ncbi:hypothetical protein GCM10007925_02310 [Sphingomonas astaxanthinifaciens DSM 22298]|uniref:Uncharacterized protein n=1 Tax=Sphingomonas astaxanthinifaciens DSM 22298 TaxID=1123267 RepID=A0ABQ5Z4E0_9SPHN|nr:hypothetical protein GCM10007925_02310 [Sphingomonas astaxanthinifaciens DSM 22298]
MGQRAFSAIVSLVLLAGLALALPAPLLAWQASEGAGAPLLAFAGLCLILCLGAVGVLWRTLGQGSRSALKAAPLGILTLVPATIFVVFAFLEGRSAEGGERLYWLGSGALWTLGLLFPLLFGGLFLFVTGAFGGRP